MYNKYDHILVSSDRENLINVFVIIMYCISKFTGWSIVVPDYKCVQMKPMGVSDRNI